MKTLYLWNKGKRWLSYNYNKLSDLAEFLTEREIEIGNFCSIGDECAIGNGVKIGNDVKISGGCTIKRNCKIGDTSKIDTCTIGSDCVIGCGCEIGYDCIIGNNCVISDNCKIGFRCKIDDNCVIKSTIFIADEKHPIYYYGGKNLQIGCQTFSFEEWIKNYEAIGGGANYYTEAQIERYKKIINFLYEYHKSLNS